MSGVSICDDWGDIPSIQAQSKERLGYPTQKLEALLDTFDLEEARRWQTIWK
jgi:hypothetical protein